MLPWAGGLSGLASVAGSSRCAALAASFARARPERLLRFKVASTVTSTNTTAPAINALFFAMCLLPPQNMPASIWPQAGKAVPVISGRNAQHSQKRPPQTGKRPEAAVGGNLLQLVARFLQPAAGCIHPQPFDKAGRGYACLFDEDASKMPRAHACLCRQRSNRQLLLQMLEGPGAKLFNQFAVRGLQSHRGSEVRLAPRPANAQHH